MSLEDVVVDLHGSATRVTQWVVPAWFADAVVVDDRGIGDPSRNQDRSRPGGTC